MTKTCLQCGAVLPYSVRACNFCDSPFSSSASCYEDASVSTGSASQRHNAAAENPCFSSGDLVESDREARAPAWRGEVSVRMEAYRVRKRKRPASDNQSHLPFDAPPPTRAVAIEEAPNPSADDFSFTIAIGRTAQSREKSHGRMEIDVSLPPSPGDTSIAPKPKCVTEASGLYPVASLEERRFAAAIDIACLLFAYGAFLALFGSLGGQFTLSKLSAAVYALTFAIVYLQYFALFTIFGGTTPGMMFRGLQVASFTGDPPSPRQMFLRSAGYILSAGTFFLGFFWAWWDEDTLTWHDRLSRTYLGLVQTHEDLQSSAVAHSPSR